MTEGTCDKVEVVEELSRRSIDFSTLQRLQLARVLYPILTADFSLVYG